MEVRVTDAGVRHVRVVADADIPHAAEPRPVDEGAVADGDPSLARVGEGRGVCADGHVVAEHNRPGSAKGELALKREALPDPDARAAEHLPQAPPGPHGPT